MLKRFDDASLHISIAYDECGIVSLPLSSLESMWSKAEEYLKSDCDIVPAPRRDHEAKMVSPRSSDTPHFVCALQLGWYYVIATVFSGNLLKYVHTRLR